LSPETHSIKGILHFVFGIEIWDWFWGCTEISGGLSGCLTNWRLGDGGCNLFYSSDPHAQRNLLAPFFFGIDSLDQFIVPTDDRVRREYPECMLQLVGRAIGSAFQFGDEHSQH
jgi:hypothetical protein